jgi:hypothetical protein
VVSLSDIAAMLGKDESYAQWLMSRAGAPPGTKTSAGMIRWRSDVEAYTRDRLPGDWRAPPDVVALSDIAGMAGRPRDQVWKKLMGLRGPPVPESEGTQTAAGMIWDRPEVVAFLEVWEPQKGPQATCDRNHPMKVMPNGRRYCPVCDVRRHKEKRQRDKTASNEQGSAQ